MPIRKFYASGAGGFTSMQDAPFQGLDRKADRGKYDLGPT